MNGVDPARSVRTDEADVLTADGGIVTIRPVRSDDRCAVTALYRDAAPESLRLRFFTQPTPATLAAEVDRLCRPQSDQHLALAAVAADTVVGIASCERMGRTDHRAEFSVFVADHHHDRGIGTLLLEHLAARARVQGITQLIGEVLPGNNQMLRVARDLSADVWSRFDDGIVDVGLGTDDLCDEALLAVDSRERAAEHASLRALLSPSSVAVVGAGHTRGGVGHETLRALREYGFAGALYAVNLTGRPIDGIPGYRSVRELPEPVDLLVVAVPADQVIGVLSEGGKVGVRGAVVLSSGFDEDGPEGHRRQAELVRTARAHSIRLVGPNCLGVINTDPRVRLNASFAPSVPSAGGLAVASQSGAVGIAVINSATRTGCGVSTFVSLGNKADVSGNDLIAYWYDDPATRAVALYLESFGNPRKFARTVRALSRRKPVLAVKSGRSAAGQRAGASHTAAAAAPAATVDALFAQAGVVRAESLGELLDAARLLTDQPLPAGDRLAVVGNAGGLNVLAADAAEGHGLRVPVLSAALQQRLARAVPGAANRDNPLDLGAGAAPAIFATAADTVAGSGEADCLLMVVIGTRANTPTGILAALGPVADRRPELPMAAVVVGSSDDPPSLGRRRAPVFDLPERAITAFGHAVRYAAWRRQPLGRRPDLTGIDPHGARGLVHQALGVGAGWQSYERTAAILAAYGIPVLDTATVTTPGDAVAAADHTGYPVVLKSADADLVHKSDAGGVRLGLCDGAAVRDAFAAVAATGRPGTGVLVQRQLQVSVELVVGVVHDRLFGSVVLLGLGGVLTDLLADRALRLVPMTDLDAGRMWRSLRSAPLLTGYRGAPPVDTAALEDLLLRVGRLAEDLPEVAELDLNPVVAGPHGAVTVDAKLRLAPVGAEPDPTLRRLGAADRT
ncbi:bifunctional acetate--CoA ligase family protein/GNAT family N-acetyltransferase [Jidongwangia harbinensis]|uniref:bifunctional acetate--CoA ligase family protein/GNAT family N-acetyltransferase n=1 Tax=Jidongwangia harbinensis TaxID=2878561 RepID=UPI001CD9D3EA|nr:GNAT family N-acetyltransferase [Jidongwangia harbinensis]MCA2219296.1 GNAT family N-acetyltransferase [Jidongwangia harbinensis]